MRHQRSADENRAESTTWVASLALAALGCALGTGALFRWVAFQWAEVPWSLTNLRHAHSHLVLFGWAIPGLFLAMDRSRGSSEANRHNGNYLFLGITAWLSWPLFLQYGYESTAIGSARLPLSVIVSGMGMVGWYVWLVRAAKDGVSEGSRPAGRLTDVSMVLLFSASIFAWVLPVAQARGSSLEQVQFLIHVFLHLLVVGFLGTGTLSLLLKSRRTLVEPGTTTAVIFIGTMLSSLLSPAFIENLWLQLAGRSGLFALGYASLFLLARAASGARWTAGLWLSWFWLVVKAGCEVVLAIMPDASLHWLLSAPVARLLYLHIVLLGAVSTLLVEWLVPLRSWRQALQVLFALGVGSWIVVTGWVPVPWSGAYSWFLAGGTGALIGLVALAVSIRMFVRPTLHARNMGGRSDV